MAPVRTHVEHDTTRQPDRVLVGHCPACGRVVITENHHEVWPLVYCHCGWTGDTLAVANRVRFERGGTVTGETPRGRVRT